MLKHAVARCGARSGVALWMALLATEAFAQAAAQPAKIDTGDTAWMIAATGLVLTMGSGTASGSDRYQQLKRLERNDDRAQIGQRERRFRNA